MIKDPLVTLLYMANMQSLLQFFKTLHKHPFR